VLSCTLLTFALCADPQVPGTIALGDLTVPIVWSRVQTRGCTDVGAQSTVDGAGYARFETTWLTHLDLDNSSDYTGRLIVRINNVRIELKAFAWDGMTKPENDALQRMYRAALWHELGHLRTLQASVDAANAEPPFSAALPSGYTEVAKAHGEAAVARITADQEAYDRAAAHGIRQETLPPPLAGPNTVVVCPSGGRRGR